MSEYIYTNIDSLLKDGEEPVQVEAGDTVSVAYEFGEGFFFVFVIGVADRVVYGEVSAHPNGGLDPNLPVGTKIQFGVAKIRHKRK